MDIPVFLWAVLAINTTVYVYVGRFVISRPQHLRPMLFWNPTILVMAGVAPPSVFVALVVVVFAFTDSGWSLLIAAVIAYVAFPVRPARELLPWWPAGIAENGRGVQPGVATDNPPKSVGSGTSLVFKGSMPDPKGSAPTVIRVGDLAVWYYENPQTIGEQVGVPPLFKYPQLAVFRNASGDPYLIVRVEDWCGKSRMLCSVGPSGDHRTIGPWSTSDRKTFVEKAIDIASAFDEPTSGS